MKYHNEFPLSKKKIKIPYQFRYIALDNKICLLYYIIVCLIVIFIHVLLGQELVLQLNEL